MNSINSNVICVRSKVLVMEEGFLPVPHARAGQLEAFADPLHWVESPGETELAMNNRFAFSWSNYLAMLFWLIRSLAGVLIFLMVPASYAADDDLSVVFIGNSITRLGPSPAVGWAGNWGMAASAMEKDYVWQVARQLPVKSVKTFSGARLEKAPKEAQLLGESVLGIARRSQLVVIQLGDNVKPKSISDFDLAYVKLLADVKPVQGILICLSTWYQRSGVDAITEKACKHAGGVYVQIGDIRSKPGYNAVDQAHPNVRSHPGDLGMAEIARRIVQAWKENAYPKTIRSE